MNVQAYESAVEAESVTEVPSQIEVLPLAEIVGIGESLTLTLIVFEEAEQPFASVYSNEKSPVAVTVIASAVAFVFQTFPPA